MKVFSEILPFFEDLLFPQKCGGCNVSGFILCPKCESECIRSDRNFEENTNSLFDYKKGPIRKIVWNIKYKNNKKLAKKVGEMLAMFVAEEIDSILKIYGGNFLIIPIPSRNKNPRSFNQAFIMAKQVALKNNLTTKNVLYFFRKTENQARLRNKKMREKNIQNSMTVKEKFKDEIKGKNIILIDDILTTGATLKEARRALRTAGAKKILAFTLAH